MEIERINENTVKFYISYMDIEDRGFERDEIWYNRDRSEQLFWQVMEEVNDEEDFNVEGPLWIQVQALEKGLEIIVTKAQLSKNGDNVELQTENGKTIDLSFNANEKMEAILDGKFEKTEKTDEDDAIEDDDGLSFVVSFNEFEDLIQLSHYFRHPGAGIDEDSLFYYRGTYYLYIAFSQLDLDDDAQENIISQILEFGNDSDASVYYLEEYGKTIFENHALTEVRKHFPAQL